MRSSQTDRSGSSRGTRCLVFPASQSTALQLTTAHGAGPDCRLTLGRSDWGTQLLASGAEITSGGRNHPVTTMSFTRKVPCPGTGFCCDMMAVQLVDWTEVPSPVTTGCSVVETWAGRCMTSTEEQRKAAAQPTGREADKHLRSLFVNFPSRLLRCRFLSRCCTSPRTQNLAKKARDARGCEAVMC